MSKLAARQIQTSSPVSIGASNSAGNLDALARADHQHGHGAHTDPAAHAAASSTANGFMTSAQVKKLAGFGTGVRVAVDVVLTHNIDLLSITNYEGQPQSASMNTHALLVGQTDPKENGLYFTMFPNAAPGLWSRTNGADFQADTNEYYAEKDWQVFVRAGTYANTLWAHKTSNVTLGTSAIQFKCIGGIDTSATPTAVGSANVGGSSSFAAAVDHQHAHGTHTSPTAHAAASASANGFMTSAQFSKLADLGVKLEASQVLLANVDLTSGVSHPDVESGTIILLVGQSNPAQNGLYFAGGLAPNTWFRYLTQSSDYANAGWHVRITGGIYNGSLWMHASSNVVLETTWIKFVGMATPNHSHTSLGVVGVQAVRATPQAVSLVDQGGGAKTATLNVSTRNDFTFTIDASAGTTVTFTNAVAGDQGTVIVRQDATGGRSLSFAGTVLRDSNTANLAPAQAANALTLYPYVFVDTGGSLAAFIGKILPVAN